MILGINGIIAGKGAISMDTDAQAFITAASITNATQKSAIDTLVKSLKSANIWSKMRAIYPFVGGTAISHTFNLKDPRDLNEAFRLMFFGGVTHSSNGVQFNGSTGFATTFWNALVQLGTQDAHQSVYYRNDNSTSLFINGCCNPSEQNSFYFGLTTNRTPFHAIRSTSHHLGSSISSTAGFFVSSRTGASAGFMKRNTTNIISTLPTSTTYANQNYFLGGRNVGGAIGEYGIGEMAFFSLGESLSDSEASNFYTAVQTFQTTLGRQV